MKQIIYFPFFLLSLSFLWSCEKDNTYPGGQISPYIAIYDLRNIYKGSDVTLKKENMFGSNTITGLVVSDHSAGNLPAGLLVIQDYRRLSQLRGISIAIGARAADYLPGDSVIVNVEGGVLKKVDGILQVTGVPETAVTKISSGNKVPVNRVPTNLILANPDKYESTLSVIVKGGFDPLPAPTDVLAGDKILNDGFGNLTLHTESKASFANNPVPVSANFYGIVFNTNGAAGQPVPQFHLRKSDDIVVLSSTIEIAPVIITGFMSDVKGGDGNYEYVQLMATKDIDFSVTPYSVVFTNNANASTPTGYPSNGWATGGMRTFKFNLTSGSATKGTFFYIGGAGKTINGSGSTSMSNSNWIRAFNYTTADGDGFGTKTTGLLANSGNASGMAVFEGTNVTVDSKPVDVVFVATGGSLYTAGPPEMGYRITNTDFYDVKNPITLENQAFYRSGSNTLSFTYNTADLGYFNMLGGAYNPALGKWVKARTQANVLLTRESSISEIEGAGATILK
ncbi:DUF5689 domain-containing protein [Chitinophagaceae bacterium LB-8]|uniref:DUF5689 domain-containing protein n=1 Tax=Paraflavisolibacter caeni TaxID=2982496 RepID=A0A9X3BF62_9BACT|nr:DUF5689 domain-containing protein [Paraflavisolibacter caeni]MCU7548304.1 DUF5689 domain-containing protein [Paraflavisolibacter caeni]